MKLSVIVPAYNSKDQVFRCADSLLAQLKTGDELIIVDDASDDGSFALLRERYGGDPGVLLVRFSANRGAAAARNAGVRLSRGDLIAFCDADDEWAAGRAEVLRAHFAADPQKLIAFTACRTLLDDDTPRTRRLAAYAEKDLIHLCACCARKEAFERIGLLDEGLRVGEDTEWLVRAKSGGIWGELLEDPLYIRHIKDDGLSASVVEEDRKSRVMRAYMRGIRRKYYEPEDRPDLSILIPVYNAGKYLREAVLSCAGSACSREIVAVDDGSSDGSAEALCSLMMSGELPCFMTAVLRAHKGQAPSRNDAFRLSRGRNILYLDADDRFLPGAVDIMARAKAEKGAPLVSALCRDFISPELSEEEAASLKTEPLPYRRMLAGCMLAERGLYEEIGLFNEEMPSSETAEWVMRVRDRKTPILELDDVVLERRYHKTNLGRLNRQTQMSSYMAMIRSRMKQRR